MLAMSISGMLVYTLDKIPALVKFLNEWSSEQKPNEAALLAIVSPPPQNKVSETVDVRGVIGYQRQEANLGGIYSQRLLSSRSTTVLKTQPASDLRNLYQSVT